MLALTANVTINSIIIKPREKGKQVLESMTELSGSVPFMWLLCLPECDRVVPM